MKTLAFSFICGLAIAAACGSDDSDVGASCTTDADCAGDLVCDIHDGVGTCHEAHHDGDETHAGHEHGTEEAGDTSDPDTAVAWATAPPTTVMAATDFSASFTVTTTGELHVTEVRACMGAGATDCGNGDETTYDETFSATTDEDAYVATINLPTAGEWTLVPFAHVGSDPHTGPGSDITVE